MRHKLVRAVRLMIFVTTVIEETACFVLLKVRATGMMVEVGWERKLVKGAHGEKKMTTLLAAVSEDLDVQTHSERSSSSTDRWYKCPSIVASGTLLVSCQEKFKAGALRQNVGKITIIHLKTLEGKKKSSCSPSLLLVFS